MFYKALGYVIWKLAKTGMRTKAPSPRALVAGAAGLGIVALAAILHARRDDLFK